MSKVAIGPFSFFFFFSPPFSLPAPAPRSRVTCKSIPQRPLLSALSMPLPGWKPRDAGPSKIRVSSSLEEESAAVSESPRRGRAALFPKPSSVCVCVNPPKSTFGLKVCQSTRAPARVRSAQILFTLGLWRVLPAVSAPFLGYTEKLIHKGLSDYAKLIWTVQG